MADGLRIALVVDKASDSILGSGLMQTLWTRHPGIEFINVGGSHMEAEGLPSYFPMECLSVMSLVEILDRLPELLRQHKHLIHTLIEAQPDMMIGIGAPDFTPGVEHKLRQVGLRTVYHINPSVQA